MRISDARLLARAILELSDKGAFAWDYAEGQVVSRGINLDLRSEIERIAGGNDER